MIGRSLFLAWIAAIALCWSGLAAAHLTPNSEIQLAIGDAAVTADIIVPQGEYAYATENPVDGSARSIALAREYLAKRVAVAGPDGRPWRIAIGRPEFVEIAGPPDLHAIAIFTPPRGATTRSFQVDWTVVVDQLPSHFALFVITSPGGNREIVGAVRSGSERIAIDRDEGPFVVLSSALGLGARHIATGYDHLLFLLALLLPAPLIAVGRRWGGLRPVRATFGKLAQIVTAFTIGHSITLVGATLGGWRLPTEPVEIAIAVSVLVSALHAVRPIFPGREPLVAGAFGLVHGLAFATLVHDAGAGIASSAVGLFGFNLGIEIVQLTVVLAVVPPLIIVSRRPAYAAFRTVGGAACAVAAGVWIIERSLAAAPMPGSATSALVAGMTLLSILALFALHGRRSSFQKFGQRTWLGRPRRSGQLGEID